MKKHILSSSHIDEMLAMHELAVEQIKETQQLIDVLENFIVAQPLNEEDETYYSDQLSRLKGKLKPNPVSFDNPPSFVKTKADHRLWAKAKKIVKAQYAKGKPYSEFTEDNWRQTAGIYHNIKYGRSNPELPTIEFEDVS